MRKLRLAIVGCGAITEHLHLPAIALSDQVEPTVLVDKSLPRARQLAERHGVPSAVDDYGKVIGKVDAAIVALPNYLHAPVATELLQHGIHVLVEKPLALKTIECDEMISVADKSGVILAVGLIRRFYASSQFVKDAIQGRLLGDIVRVELREGTIFRWPVASDFMFRRESGGGVLADLGVHALDLLLWWLGDYASVEYYDDAMGGAEADCELHLRFRCGATAIVELSWTRNLKNTCTLHAEHGLLEVGTGFDPVVRLKIRDHDVVLAGHAKKRGAAEGRMVNAFHRQLSDFVEAILSHREPFVGGQEGKRAVELIETCRAVRQPLEHP